MAAQTSHEAGFSRPFTFLNSKLTHARPFKKERQRNKNALPGNYYFEESLTTGVIFSG
ncbi:MAG: hypothetical protein H0X66_04580 [Verrucomicrobia bacterium]|nr:hypothetical protein [Verrucomicrobiota bacterium]